MNVLFFSRGRGHGHAIPDMAIVNSVLEQTDSFSFHFASYATGASTFREAGYAVIDMELSENNSYLPTFLIASRVIRELQPAIVVSHEEFAALVAAETEMLPSVFISAWLPLPPSLASDSLSYADGIIVLEEAGIFPISDGITCPVQFVGPLRRVLAYNTGDRERARAELSIPHEAKVVTVIPGGYATETRSPIVDLVIDGFLRLTGVKRLRWLAGDDFELVCSRLRGIDGAEVLRFASVVEQSIVASNVVLTKGTRGTSLDSAALGVPTISLSNGANPIDDLLVARMPSNLSLNPRAITGESLAIYIEHACEHPEQYLSRNPFRREVGPMAAATALVREMRRLTVDRAR